MSRWNNSFRNARRAQRRGERGTDAKFILLLLAGALLIASGVLTWNMQRVFTGNTAVALTMTFLLTLAPPVLTSFLIPWSPAGMLLFSINLRTVGQAVVIAAVMFFLYYTYLVQSAWWAAQPGAAQAQMPAMQTIAGIIGFIVIPALVWAPVSRDELQEVVQQDHDVRRYRLMVAADIAILQKTLMVANQRALVGFANLAANERDELVSVMRGLVTGIDRLQQEAFGNLRQATGLAYSVQSIDDDPEIGELLDRAEDVFTLRLIAEPEPEQVIEPTAYQPVHAAAQSNAAVSEAPPVPHGGPRWPTVAHGEKYAAVCAAFPERETISAKKIAPLLGVADETARQYIRDWRSAGLVSGDGLPNGTYRFIRHNGDGGGQ